MDIVCECSDAIFSVNYVYIEFAKGFGPANVQSWATTSRVGIVAFDVDGSMHFAVICN